MALAAGTATIGRSGAIALKSLNTGGTLRYIPVNSFNPTIDRSRQIIDVVNNTALPTIYEDGYPVGLFTLTTSFFAGVMPADLFARAFGSVVNDTDTTNFHQISQWPDNLSFEAASNYGRVKFSSLAMQVQFSRNGARAAWQFQLSGMSYDPKNGTLLTTPSAGALTSSKALGYAQTSFTGASDVVGFSAQIGTPVIDTPPPSGLGNGTYGPIGSGMQTTMIGTVQIVQKASAATVAGSDGNPASVTVAIGGTGAGTSFTFRLVPISLGLPTNTGLNTIVSSYMLLSADGSTLPVVFADL